MPNRQSWPIRAQALILNQSGRSEGRAQKVAARAASASAPRSSLAPERAVIPAWTDSAKRSQVTVSLGVAAHPAHGSTAAALLAAAETALGRAKREHNCVVIGEPPGG